MNGPWFFLSYASSDSLGHEHLKQFHQDLAREVYRMAGRGAGVSASEIGFLDSSGIRTGQYWDDVIGKVLNASRVLICLYSRGYFGSPFCGKEFEFFRQRIDEYVRSGSKIEVPPLIIPVLWDNPLRLPQPLPDAVTRIQHKDDEFGQTYAREGLYFISKIDKYKSEYDEFLLRLAGRIFSEATPNRLRPLSSPQPFAAIESAFDRKQSPSSAGLVSKECSRGPKVAKFVYVVGRTTDYSSIRREVHCYGDDAPEWQPYYPEVKKAVGIISQDVATTEGLLYVSLPIDEDLLLKLREAEAMNAIVVLVVDPWSIRMPGYQEHMRRFDEAAFINCGVLIPWNKTDEETVTSLEALERSVKMTFTHKFILGNYFRGTISSADELRKEICDTINEVRRRLLLRANVEQLVPTTITVLPSISGSIPNAHD